MSEQLSLPTGVSLDLAVRFRGFENLDEPRVIIDEAAMIRNIDDMAKRVRGHAALHPHIKTHKSIEIARMQKEHGAAGFTVARPYEAAMLLRDSLFPVTLAYPLINPEIVASLLRETESADHIRFIADSTETLEAVIAGARAAGRTASVFIKVDVGLHRCGVEPTGGKAVSLATAIDTHPDLAFAGILSHAGQAYGAGNLAAITAIAKSERNIMSELRHRIEKTGIAVPCVSVGSTPTLVGNAGFDGIDEVRPGNYVFYDLTAVRLGLVDRNALSLGIAAQIIAINDHYAIANVGSKTLSSDLGAHGTSATKSFGEAWMIGHDTPLPVAKLSEEHAFLDFGDKRPKVGTPIIILPNHACPVANLSGGMLLLGADGKPDREIHVEGFVGNWR